MSWDPPASRLLLLRHGESTWNAAGRWQGQEDPPLSEHGRRTAVAIAPALAGQDVEAVYCSDLARAYRTAALIAEGADLAAPITDVRLRERDVGRWSGLTDAQIAARWPGEPAAWRAAQQTATPGGGEDAATVAERALSCLREIGARHPARRLLVVTHGGVISAVAHALGADLVSVPHLGGLWLSLRDGRLEAGAVFDADGRSSPVRSTQH